MAIGHWTLACRVGYVAGDRCWVLDLLLPLSASQLAQSPSFFLTVRCQGIPLLHTETFSSGVSQLWSHQRVLMLNIATGDSDLLCPCVLQFWQIWYSHVESPLVQSKWKYTCIHESCTLQETAPVTEQSKLRSAALVFSLRGLRNKGRAGWRVVQHFTDGFHPGFEE